MPVGPVEVVVAQAFPLGIVAAFVAFVAFVGSLAFVGVGQWLGQEPGQPLEVVE